MAIKWTTVDVVAALCKGNEEHKFMDECGGEDISPSTPIWIQAEYSLLIDGKWENSTWSIEEFECHTDEGVVKIDVSDYEGLEDKLEGLMIGEQNEESRNRN